MLDARQLGLKLIANVTYGYTGANFSGRMPCIEVRLLFLFERLHSVESDQLVFYLKVILCPNTTIDLHEIYHMTSYLGVILCHVLVVYILSNIL